MTLRIQCWSGPRNISTALMYSFRQRADTTVLDEPLYAHFLHATGRVHPGRAQVLGSQSTDQTAVIDDVVFGPCATPVLYMKQMAHHLRGVDPRVLTAGPNVLLTREPAAMLRSLAEHLPDCGLADTGLTEQIEVLDGVLATGGLPVVVDSQALLRDPAGMLARLCEQLGLAFDPAMLSWPAGPKPEDGVWAPEWYESVHRSTGFAPPDANDEPGSAPAVQPMPDRLVPVLDEAAPLYAHLLEYAISP